MRAWRKCLAVGLVLSTLCCSLCAEGIPIVELGDAGLETPLVSRDVSDCAELNSALGGGAVGAEVIVLSKQFSCSREEWGEEVRLERNLVVVGENGSGVEWQGEGQSIVVGRGMVLRLEETNFLVDRLERDSLPPFLRLEEDALVSFAGVVLGSRCCGASSGGDACDTAGGEILDQAGGDADRWNGGYQGASTLDTVAQSSWAVCQSLVRCSASDLDDLLSGRESEAQPLDSECDLELRPVFLESQTLTPTGEGGGGGTSGTDIFVIVVIVLVVAVVALLGFVMFRRIRRQRRLARLQSQVVKMGPVLSIPSMSSASGSMADKLIDPTPRDIRPKEEPNSQPKKPKVFTGGMDVSGIRLTIPIGKGAFSTVYKGSWGGMAVAVKILKHQPDQKGVSDKDLFEAQLGFSIVHANLVHTYGSQTKKCQDMTPRSSRPSSTSIGEDIARGQSRVTSASSDCFSDMAEALKAQGRDEYETWIVMEYCDRGSLQASIRRGAFFDDAERTRPRMVDILLTAMDIAKGMERLHSMSIVHGDLKPRNVLLRTKKGDVRGYNCKVGDFGFSRYVPDSHITTASCGAVNYMPPELLAEGTLTPAADVYSFGLLLWELMVGKDPYPSKTHNEIIVLVTSGSRPKTPESIPTECMDLLEACWHQDHKARPTFSAIVMTLKELLANPSMDWPSKQSGQEQSRGRSHGRSALQDLMTFSFDTSTRVPSSAAHSLPSTVELPSPTRAPSSRGVSSSTGLTSSNALPPQPPSSSRSTCPTPLTGRSEMDPLSPQQDLPPTSLDVQDGSQMNAVQDFPPTPQDVQAGGPVAQVTSANLKNLFLKGLQTGQGAMPQIDDLLATVNIGQKPLIPTGATKPGSRRDGAADGSLRQTKRAPPKD